MTLLYRFPTNVCAVNIKLYFYLPCVTRFYMVSGEKGWYPDGTDCRSAESHKSYCVKESELFASFLTAVSALSTFSSPHSQFL